MCDVANLSRLKRSSGGDVSWWTRTHDFALCCVAITRGIPIDGAEWTHLLVDKTLPFLDSAKYDA